MPIRAAANGPYPASVYSTPTDVEIVNMLVELLSYLLLYPAHDEKSKKMRDHIKGLVQERRNSSALAMELRLSCINSSISS